MTNAPTQETAEVLMNRHVKTVTEDLSLADVIQFLTSHDLSFAPVVRTENGRQLLVGVISDPDSISRSHRAASLAKRRAASSLFRRSAR